MEFIDKKKFQQYEISSEWLNVVIYFKKLPVETHSFLVLQVYLIINNFSVIQTLCDDHVCSMHTVLDIQSYPPL